MNRTTLSIVIALVVIFIMLLVPAFYNDTVKQQQSIEIIQAEVCDTLTTGCSAKIDNLNIEIKFPENIIYLNPFPVEVNFSGKDVPLVDDVKVEFVMIDMNMGTNTYQLIQNNNDNLLWKGKVVLPVCITGRIDWQVYLLVKINEQSYKTGFQFRVIPPTQR